MARKYIRDLLIPFTSSFLLISPSPPAWAQTTPKTAMSPIGEEAFGILKLFYDYDHDAPLEAKIVDKDDLPSCAREKIVFHVRDSRVVGYLGIPKGGTPPYPCVLALHGVGGSKEYWWEQESASSGGSMTRALLSAGIAVFTPDAEYHGERIASNGFQSPVAMIFDQRVARMRDMTVQSVIECRRAIDYLETRSEIDTSRIGVTGQSLGGIESFVLTALDSRVKVAVTCIIPVGNLDRLGDPVRLPGNYTRALGGCPILMQMGRNDPFCTPEQARGLYELIPGSKKEIVFYDSGHDLPEEYVPKALKWFQDGLK